MLAPSEFEPQHVRGYLDTATYGLPPASALDALTAAADGWRGRQSWSQWEEDGEACRQLLAKLVSCRAEDVALLPAVSVAAGLVAVSLPAGPDDNVVLAADDFASTIFPWAGLESRGVDVRTAPVTDLAASADERTALIAASYVQSADGAVVDLRALRATGARLFIDVSQALGAVSMDLDGVDYVACHTYKWLLCARGLSFLAVRPDRLAEIEPWTSGWKSRDNAYESYYGLPRQLTDDARRLDVSLSWLIAASARRSLELIDALGTHAIAEHNLRLARAFAVELGLPEPDSPILRLTVEAAEHAVSNLREAGVVCSARAGSVRMSFHLYNDDEDVARAVEALADTGVHKPG